MNPQYKKGVIELCVLSILRRRDCYGYEIAEELGLLDQVLESGWKSLSAKETGRIGGIMTRRKRESKKAESTS